MLDFFSPKIGSLMLENCVKESGVGAYLLGDDFGSLLFPDQVALSIKSCIVFSQLAAASCLSMLLGTWRTSYSVLLVHSLALFSLLSHLLKPRVA